MSRIPITTPPMTCGECHRNARASFCHRTMPAAKNAGAKHGAWRGSRDNGDEQLPTKGKDSSFMRVGQAEKGGAPIRTKSSARPIVLHRKDKNGAQSRGKCVRAESPSQQKVKITSREWIPASKDPTNPWIKTK